jgi:hypothetical protein
MGAIALVVAAGRGVVAATASTAGSGQSGTVWMGTVGGVPSTQPSPWDAAHRPNARLVVSATAVDATFEGYTGATHDDPSARTSCSIHYRLVRREGSLNSYRQLGLSRYAGGSGYVANAPCEMSRGGALKTVSSGSTLRADFGLTGEPFKAYWRGYLRRS